MLTAAKQTWRLDYFKRCIRKYSFCDGLWDLSATIPIIFIGLLHLKKGLTEKNTLSEILRKGNRFERLRMPRNRSWRSPI